MQSKIAVHPAHKLAVGSVYMGSACVGAGCGGGRIPVGTQGRQFSGHPGPCSQCVLPTV